MKSSIGIFLILVIAIAFYFLGKKSGGQTNISVVQNTSFISEIAELAALQVNGSTNVILTNKDGDDGVLVKIKNYLVENTLSISLPYEAKYGVDLDSQKVKIDSKDSLITLYLPNCKLLSMQLKLDRIDAMSQTGIFNSISMNDFIKAQKELYAQAIASLSADTNNIKLAQNHIGTIIQKYYAPMGYKATCVFGENNPNGIPKIN